MAELESGPTPPISEWVVSLLPRFLLNTHSHHVAS